MPDPIPSGTPPDEPKRKSGFDPAEYEAEKAAANQETEMSIQKRMYRDAITISENRLKEIAEALSNNEYDNLTHLYDGYKGDKDAYKKIHESGLVILDGNESRRIFSEPITSIGSSSFYVRIVNLPRLHRVLAGPGDKDLLTIGITILRDGQKFVADADVNSEQLPEEDRLKPHPSDHSFYIVVLGPEMKPVIIQTRPWDLDNTTLSQKLANYPNHELSDEECAAILQAIATAPL